MRQNQTLVALCACLCCVALPAMSQQYDGEVTGWLSGVVHKYNGDFTDDSWGPGAMLSLQYAPIHQLGIEARVGLGEYQWKVGPNALAAHPQYFGAGAKVGDNYPGLVTLIEPVNESRLTTIDLLVNYTLVDNIAAIPFISAGVGWVNFAPSTSEAHEALPNNASGAYPTSAVSIPIGAGVRIPFSYRAGIVLRGEYRFVFSHYLDDVSFNGTDDGITSVSVGFSYRFTNPPEPSPSWYDGCVRPYHTHCQRHNGPCNHIPCYQLQGEQSQDGVDQDDSQANSGANPEHIPIDSSNVGTVAPGGTTDTTVTGMKDTATTPKASPSAASAIAPCPQGRTRLCVQPDMSVCVDMSFTPGSERIKWEDAFVYDPKDPDAMKTLRQADKPSPCYAFVVRQTPTTFYLCEDCCFEKQPLGNGVIYVPINGGKQLKGDGMFEPSRCPDCKAVSDRGE